MKIVITNPGIDVLVPTPITKVVLVTTEVDKIIVASNGAQGPPGEDGSVWYSGSGLPSSLLGKVGDWYIDEPTTNVYQKATFILWEHKFRMSSGSFSDAEFEVYNNANNTKKIHFDVSEVAPAVDRKITFPDRDVDLGELAYTNSTPTPAPFGGIPKGTTFTQESIPQVLDSLLYGNATSVFLPFDLMDWVGPVDGRYSVTFTHTLDTDLVEVEVWNEARIPIWIDRSILSVTQVQLSVPSDPDLRCAGYVWIKAS